MADHNILCIIYSYNRALQLELLLRTMTSCIQNKNIHYAVIWHSTPAHHPSYELLIKDWTPKGIVFFERSNELYSWYQLLPYLRYPFNLKRYLYYSKFRKRIDNFKFLFEEIIRKSNCEFVFGATDDQVYIEKFTIPDQVLDLIAAEPDNVTFKFNIGMNFDEFKERCPNLKVQVLKDLPCILNHPLVTWNYYDPMASSHWGYPFSVESQIYSTASILQMLNSVLYHMPTTLEAFGLAAVRKKRIYSKGIGTSVAPLTHFSLNLVSPLSQNFNLGFDVEKLRKIYEAGYRIHVAPIKISNVNYKLSDLNLCRPDDFSNVVTTYHTLEI